MSPISVTPRLVRINDLEIVDEETVKIMNEWKEEVREENLVSSINIGASVLRNRASTEKIDYVQKEFEKLLRELKDKTEEWDEELKDSINSSLEESLDPDEPMKPINRLKSKIMDKLEEIHRLVGSREDVKQVEEYGTRKGDWFEEDIEQHLSETTLMNDSIEKVGKMNIEGTQRKVGDVLVTVNEPNLPEFNIVLEVKSGYDFTMTGPKALKKQLSDSMGFRKAKGGIAIVKQKHMKLRQKVWEDAGNNRFIIAVDVDDMEGIYDYTLLEVAYGVMRNRIIQSFDSSDVKIPEVDSDRINDLATEIIESLESVRGLKKNCTDVIKGVEEIKKKINIMNSDVKGIAEEIKINLKSN
tara:strand:- start:64 stop:1131 length:1068 start_codon:yes stop_codon:yes gene_type:complete